MPLMARLPVCCATMASHTGHQTLQFDPNTWGEGSYKQPSREEIGEALTLAEPANKKQKTFSTAAPSTRQLQSVNLPSEQTFPAPLVVWDDELYHDPHYPPQSLQECVDVQNVVTAKRRTIYVVPPPEIADEVGFMTRWMTPTTPAPPRKRKAAAVQGGESSAGREVRASPPGVEDIAEYLRAFYHGLPAKVLEERQLRFARWDDGSSKPQTKRPQTKRKQNEVTHVALETGDEAIRTRCRLAPDEVFNGQLNQNDLLDAALRILPADAYALLMLVHHDLYEDEADDFCCGRAYGGSRIAVVSTARYRPELDVRQNFNRDRSWPASHFHVPSIKGGRIPRPSDIALSRRYPASALAAAVDAFNSLTSPTSAAELSALWLGRVCKTASHELGHCFGIDHCTYYACVMQGTANVAEDSRQPPYLCPVDLAKVLKATDAQEKEHYGALLKFCEHHREDRLFAAFAAWLRVRLSENEIL